MTSWKLKDLAEHYQQLPQASMTHLSKVTCNYVTRAFLQNPLVKLKFLTKNGNFLLPLLCHVASGTMVVRQKASNEMALVPTQVVGKGKQLRLHVPDSDKVVQDHLMQLQAFERPPKATQPVTPDPEPPQDRPAP